MMSISIKVNLIYCSILVLLINVGYNLFQRKHQEFLMTFQPFEFVLGYTLNTTISRFIVKAFNIRCFSHETISIKEIANINTNNLLF